HWADMAAWPQWNDGIETIDVDGPFAVGTTFIMTPPGDEPIRMRLVEIEPGASFTDEMDAGDFVVRTEHRLESAAGGLTRIVYRTQITGEAAGHVGPELGPQITADFPDVVAALAPLGLTHVQFVLLAAAWWLNSCGQDPNQLSVARQAGTDVKMTSEVLRKLEAKGLVVRTVDAADTRARKIRVTERGGELALAAVT